MHARTTKANERRDGRVGDKPQRAHETFHNHSSENKRERRPKGKAMPASPKNSQTTSRKLEKQRTRRKPTQNPDPSSSFCPLHFTPMTTFHTAKEGSFAPDCGKERFCDRGLLARQTAGVSQYGCPRDLQLAKERPSPKILKRYAVRRRTARRRGMMAHRRRRSTLDLRHPLHSTIVISRLPVLRRNL